MVNIFNVLIMVLGVIVAGVLIGINFYWYIQLFIIYAIWVFISGKEGVEGFFTEIFAIIFSIGLIIGNISYLWQTDGFVDIGNPFIVQKEKQVSKDVVLYTKDGKEVHLSKKDIQ